MPQLSEDELNKLLLNARGQLHTFGTGEGTAFESILQKAAANDSTQNIKFLQLRNTTILMLLVIVVNVIVVSSVGNKNITEQVPQTAAPYLQPYNLNLY